MAEPNKLFNFNLPGPYQAELARIADQQRMAEMLQAQSQAPSERFSYKGIEARTPATAGLAKLLQGFGGAYFQKQAREQEKALGEKYRGDQMADLTALGTAINAPAIAGSAEIPARSEIQMPSEELGGGPGREAAPAIPAVTARQAGYIGPEMIAKMKTTEGANQVLALSLAQRQAQIEAERRANEPYTLAEGAGRYQPMPGGQPAKLIAGGVPKTPFANIDVKDFTPESVAAATKPDGTVDRTLLRAIQANRTGDLGVYDEYVRQTRAAGKTPMGIDQFIINQKIAGRTPATPAQPRERFVYDASRGGRVNLDTGEFVPVTQGGVPIESRDKPLTEVQGRSTGFAARADEADKIIKAVGESGKITPSLLKSSAGAVPVIGGGLETITNFATSSAQQQVEQAQRNFVNALLRQESGAAIGKDEFSNAQKQYFPQLGDLPEVIKQKSKNRETAIDALKVQAGPGIQKMPTRPNVPTIIRARNPATNTEIISFDGGITWQPAGGK